MKVPLNIEETFINLSTVAHAGIVPQHLFWLAWGDMDQKGNPIMNKLCDDGMFVTNEAGMYLKIDWQGNLYISMVKTGGSYRVNNQRQIQNIISSPQKYLRKLRRTNEHII